MYTKKSLRDNTKNNSENIDQFLSSDFNQSDFNSFIDNDVRRDKDKKKMKNWWKDDEECSETSSLLLGTGKNFMKPKGQLQEKEEIPEIVVNNDIECLSDSNADLKLDLNKSSDPSQTLYNDTIKENESNIDASYPHPITFEGFTQSAVNNVETNDKTHNNPHLYEVETLKANLTMLSADGSNDNFQESADYTKKEHLLSKVSLHDSFDDPKANRSSIRYEDFMSSGISDDHHNIMEGIEFLHKTSINPASGDSFNTQGITNITDTVLGDNTAADLAALHQQYEHMTKESFEPTVNSNGYTPEIVKDLEYDKSYPPPETSTNNLDSTVNTRSFGMKLMKLSDLDYEKETPIPSPRKKKSISRSNDHDFSNSEFTNIQHSRLSDNGDKKKSSPFSHVQSSGYGSKHTALGNNESGKISNPVKENEKSKIKNNFKPSSRNVKQNVPQLKSNIRSISKSVNRNKEPTPVLRNETYKIKQLPKDDSDLEYNTVERLPDKDHYQRPFDTSTNEWHEKWLQERILVKKLQAESMAQERDFKKQIENMSQQYERKISHLESQLVRTRDQLNSIPDFNNKSLGSNVTTEDIERIKKDIKAQESIVSAYEKDNEKLRQEMKVFKLKQKSEDHVDSLENERLISQIASLKADLDCKEIEVRNLRQMTKDFKGRRSDVSNDFYIDEITQLKSDLQNMNKKYLSSESERQQLEMKFNKICNETEKMSNHYHDELNIEKIEKEKLMESHKAEVDDLKRKIKWYLENQAILDKESKKTKAKEEEITELKRQLDTSGTIKISSNIRAKVRTVDIARIKQLEEENMSLKEDLYSLARGKNIGNVATKRTVQFLEEKIKFLEEDLENNVNKENQSLRSLQQQFETTKHQYEETIHDMELDAFHAPNKQIESEKNIRIKDLKEKIEELMKDSKKKNALINKLKVNMKTALKDGENNKTIHDKDIRKIEPDSRIESLYKELRDKDIQLQRLQIQNDYFRSTDRNVPNQLELEAENAKLKSQVAHLTFELDNYVRVIDEIKNISLKNEQIIRDECRDEIRKCEEYHREQLRNVKTDFVGRHSESETAALQSQIDVQKNYISHLQNEISDFTVKIRTCDSKNEELFEAKKQIESLKSELFDLRLIWSNKPGLEMIDRLRSKILRLEEKESLKGLQLDEYVDKVVKKSTKPFQEEVERWRTIVAKKNQNLLQVQNELNHLLEALEELRRQGISIPKIQNKI